jgi:hypothetical protein
VAGVVDVGDVVTDGSPGVVVPGQECALVGFAAFLDLDVALDAADAGRNTCSTH